MMISITYLALDISYSVTEYAGPQQTQVAARILNALGSELRTPYELRLSVLQFSDRAAVTVPLSKVSEIPSIPALAGGAGTSYGSLFRLLRRQILNDVVALQGAGESIARPVVFLISDGQPGDDWISAFRLLTEYDREMGEGFSCFPIVLPVPIGNADIATLQRVAHPHWLKVIQLHDDSKYRELLDVARDHFEKTLLPAISVVEGRTGLEFH